MHDQVARQRQIGLKGRRLQGECEHGHGYILPPPSLPLSSVINQSLACICFLLLIYGQEVVGQDETVHTNFH
jgi:hypothetical protein